MSRIRSTAIAVVGLSLALGVERAPARAGDALPVSRTLVATIALDERGDATAHDEITFPAAAYDAVRAATPSPTPFLRRLRPARPDYVLGASPKCAYSAEKPLLTLDWSARGIARHLGDGQWQLDLDATHGVPDTTKVADTRPQVVFPVAGTLDRFETYGGTATWSLPPGSTAIEWDAYAHRLRWSRPQAPAKGEARLDARLETKPRIMASAYKIYAKGAGFSAQRVGAEGRFLLGADMSPPWVARVLLRNAGTGALRDVRVRYKLEGYTTDWSPWEEFPEVAPGATAVSVYYPVILGTVAKLHDDTPANLLAEWAYDDGSGPPKTRSTSARLTILGINEFVFNDLEAGEQFDDFFAQGVNNGPLLAAWVSRNDAVVKQFGALANKNAGGVFAPQDDETALRVIGQCYDLLRRNGFTYQAPPGLVSHSTSFDVKSVQSIKFPRDVIMARSGTCIDLAILLASMVNSLGLSPLLVVVPGHCFPAVRMPPPPHGSGRIYAVESTLIGGGVRFGSASFHAALRTGNAEFEKALTSGDYVLLPVTSLWDGGVNNPELDDLPADIFQRWPISEAGDPAAVRDPFVGTWSGSVTQELQGGATASFPIAVTVEESQDLLDTVDYVATSRSSQQVSTGGAVATADVVQNFTGVAVDGALVLEGVLKSIRVGAGAKPVEGEVDAIVARLVDGRLEGKIGRKKDGWSKITLRLP